MNYREKHRVGEDAAREWHGAYRPYDIVKEGSIALVVVLVLALVFALLFSSPDERPTTIASWSRQDPVDFVSTALSELDGTSATATYGPPYNHGPNAQHVAFIHPQAWLGVAHPINAPVDYVIDPLRSIPGQPALHAALRTYVRAGAPTQGAWAAAYAKALAKAHTGAGNAVLVPAGNYGPVAPMMAGLLGDAQSGALDGALLSNPQLYQTDYTKVLLLLSDGGALKSRAQAEGLLGSQWGMMNETGSYPGQSWLWLYTFWYQIKPFSTSPNADLFVILIVVALSLGFVLVPFIPGVRDLPRKIPIYRLIWREHYRSAARSARGVTGTTQRR